MHKTPAQTDTQLSVETFAYMKACWTADTLTVYNYLTARIGRQCMSCLSSRAVS